MHLSRYQNIWVAYFWIRTFSLSSPPASVIPRLSATAGHKDSPEPPVGCTSPSFPYQMTQHLQHLMGGIPSHGVWMPIRMMDSDAPNWIASGFSSQFLQPSGGSQPAPVHILGTQGMLDEIFRWMRTGQWDSEGTSVVQTADTEFSSLLESCRKDNSLAL